MMRAQTIIPAAKWIVPIMGFTESASRETGIERLWKRLRPIVDGTSFIVTPYEWDEDLAGLAKFILRNSPDGRAEAMVIAYSWGCGVGFLRFAQEAAAHGLRISYAALADPVYRSTVFPTWLPFNPRSVAPFLRPKIKVPRSVRRVEWVRQNFDYPRGHDLVAEDPAATSIGLGRYVACGHGKIDDSEEFHVLAEHWAKAFLYDLDPADVGEPLLQGAVNPTPRRKHA